MNPRIEILATIRRFSAITLDEEALAGIARVDFNAGIEAVSWLMQKRFIYRHKGGYHITEPGEEYLTQSGLYTEKQKNLKRWKDEVLTGVREGKSTTTGKMITFPSKIDRAVLSTKSKDAHEGVRPDQMLMEIENLLELRKALCTELAITMDEYDSLLKDGRIRVCKYGGNHLGVFDRHSKNRWQHICRRCRKKLRKSRDQRKRFEGNSGHPQRIPQETRGS